VSTRKRHLAMDDSDHGEVAFYTCCPKICVKMWRRRRNRWIAPGTPGYREQAGDIMEAS
jgi:hypothetical protein